MLRNFPQDVKKFPTRHPLRSLEASPLLRLSCPHRNHPKCWPSLLKKSFPVLYLHEDGYSHYSNYPSSSVHWDSINRIVNPEDYEHPGEEKVGESSNSGDNARSPRLEDIAASADGDHAGYRAVDRLEQRIFPARGFRDEEADYATSATSHLKRINQKAKTFLNHGRALWPGSKD